jgi:hypothetical protein
MSLAIIDAREWQNSFDLKTGDRRGDDGAAAGMVKGVLARHPFPGDTDDRGNAWVTDTALDFIKEYDPRLVWLTYAQQFYKLRYDIMNEKDRQALLAAAFHEVERFAEASGFTPIIVGTGGLAPFKSFIDIARMDGLALCTHWSARYAGIHEPSGPDLKRLQDIPEIEMIVPKDELLKLFAGSPCDPSRVPDYLVVAREGYGFKATGGSQRRVSRVQYSCFRIPVSTHAGRAESITDVKALALESLRRRKTAIIMLEGVGLEDFPWPHTEASNGREWYFYETGDAQYLTVSTGEHRPFDYPTGYKSFDEVTGNDDYPLSGYFTSMPAGTIGEAFEGRSVAVGNRSMYTHMVPAADISLECFARNLYNQGTMAVIHRQGK